MWKLAESFQASQGAYFTQVDVPCRPLNGLTAASVLWLLGTAITNFAMLIIGYTALHLIPSNIIKRKCDPEIRRLAVALIWQRLSLRESLTHSVPVGNSNQLTLCPLSVQDTPTHLRRSLLLHKSCWSPAVLKGVASGCHCRALSTCSLSHAKSLCAPGCDRWRPPCTYPWKQRHWRAPCATLIWIGTLHSAHQA